MLPSNTCLFLDRNRAPEMPRVILTVTYNRLSDRISLAARFASTNDVLNAYAYDKRGRTTSSGEPSDQPHGSADLLGTI